MNSSRLDSRPLDSRPLDARPVDARPVDSRPVHARRFCFLVADARRAPRQAAACIGWCSFPEVSPDVQSDCRVVDISQLGLGIVLRDGAPSSDLVGRAIAVDMPIVGTAAHIRLEGEVRNAAVRPDGTLRLGIESLGLTDLEHSVVAALGVPTVRS